VPGVLERAQRTRGFRALSVLVLGGQNCRSYRWAGKSARLCLQTAVRRTVKTMRYPLHYLFLFTATLAGYCALFMEYDLPVPFKVSLMAGCTIVFLGAMTDLSER